MNDKELRISAADLRIYSWQQQPPGTTPAGMASRRVRSTASPTSTQAEFLQNEVKRALYRLERYLTPEQKSVFRQSLERQKDSSENVVNMGDDFNFVIATIKLETANETGEPILLKQKYNVAVRKRSSSSTAKPLR